MTTHAYLHAHQGTLSTTHQLISVMHAIRHVTHVLENLHFAHPALKTCICRLRVAHALGSVQMITNLLATMVFAQVALPHV